MDNKIILILLLTFLLMNKCNSNYENFGIFSFLDGPRQFEYDPRSIIKDFILNKKKFSNAKDYAPGHFYVHSKTDALAGLYCDDSEEKSCLQCHHGWKISKVKGKKKCCFADDKTCYGKPRSGKECKLNDNLFDVNSCSYCHKGFRIYGLKTLCK